jgi:hypothetical protein
MFIAAAPHLNVVVLLRLLYKKAVPLEMQPCVFHMDKCDLPSYNGKNTTERRNGT